MDLFFLVAWFHRFFSENHRLNPVVHETHIIYVALISLDLIILLSNEKKHLWIYTPVGNSHLGSFQLLTPVAKRSIWMFPCLMYFIWTETRVASSLHITPKFCLFQSNNSPWNHPLVASIHFLCWSNQKNGSLKKKSLVGKNIQLNSTNSTPSRIFLGSPESRKTENGNHQTDLQPCEEQRLTNF